MIAEIQATNLLFKYFGLVAVELKQLYGFDHQIFITKAKHSQADSKPLLYTYKIIKDQGNEKEVFKQIASVQHTLYEKGFQVSSPVMTLENDLLQTITRDEGNWEEDRILLVLRYLKGKLLSEVEVSQTQLNSVAYDCGSKLAKLDNELKKIKLNINMERMDYKWNITQSQFCQSSLHFIHDMELRDAVSQIVEKFHLEISKNSEHLRKCLIHGDVNEANIIIEPSEDMLDEISTNNINWSVKGFIDFNDMQFSKLVFDIAILITYMMNKASLCDLDHNEAARNALAGYQSVVPLNDAEMAVLYWCVLKRMAVSVCAGSEEAQNSGHQQKMKDLHSMSNLLKLTWRMKEKETLKTWL